MGTQTELNSPASSSRECCSSIGSFSASSFANVSRRHQTKRNKQSFYEERWREHEMIYLQQLGKVERLHIILHQNHTPQWFYVIEGTTLKWKANNTYWCIILGLWCGVCSHSDFFILTPLIKQATLTSQDNLAGLWRLRRIRPSLGQLYPKEEWKRVKWNCSPGYPSNQTDQMVRKAARRSIVALPCSGCSASFYQGKLWSS